MTTTERLLQFVEYKGISKYEFHKKNGLSNGFLDKSRAIGTDKCARILENYPEINPEWLITGEGKMIRDKNTAEISNFIDSIDLTRAISFGDVKKFGIQLRTLLLSYFSEEPEKFKDFKEELSKFSDILKERLPFMDAIDKLQNVICQQQSDKYYHLIEKEFEGYIELTKKVAERIEEKDLSYFNF